MSSVEQLLRERFKLGMDKYGHGVRVYMDTTKWGTSQNSWLEMAREEFLDGIIYTVADYIKENDISGDWSEEDDNELILRVLKEAKYRESPKHSKIIENLLDIIE